MRIVDQEVKELVREIESKGSVAEVDPLLKKLVVKLQKNCLKLSCKEHSTPLSEYPLDEEGFAVSFDPVEDEIGFRECWEKYGLVVGRGVVSKEMCRQTTERMKQLLQKLSNNRFDLDDPSTYDSIPLDDNNVPCISRGFFEVYHDNSLAKLRQSIRIYLHHVLIWGRTDLWTSFDRFGIKLPQNEDSKGLPLHVDQNPLVHAKFKTTQGVLALVDCPVPQGTFVSVPCSRNLFSKYEKSIKKHDPDYRGEYVEAGWDPSLDQELTSHAQPIPIRAGDLVSWDSRTTHANSPNLAATPRMVAYISAGPATNLRENRQEGFRTGIGQNVREALMHASKPPRYTKPETLAALREPEELTYLGKLLYGEERYPAAT